MHNFSESNIEQLAVHVVGNKTNGEPLYCTKSCLKLNNEDARLLLMNYFFYPFKNNEYFHFYDDEGVENNDVFTAISAIFDEPDSLFDQSVNLAKYLYEQSNHPKIKSGELYVVYFSDCIVDGEAIDAVGIFKSENKDSFLKILPSGDTFRIESEEGLNISKLDKGCIIFNTERDKGYMVTVVDTSAKGAEAHYWIDDFLHLRPRKDEYYNTQNVLTICKNFVQNELPQHFEVTKADQADFLNKSVKFFKEKDSFDMQEFAKEVIEQPEVIKSFTDYKNNYSKEFDLDIVDNFDISETAVKKQARVFKSVIKLDKNFHIYVHGNRNLIEQGVDDKGRKFYKIYYQEEL